MSDYPWNIEFGDDLNINLDYGNADLPEDHQVSPSVESSSLNYGDNGFQYPVDLNIFNSIEPLVCQTNYPPPGDYGGNMWLQGHSQPQWPPEPPLQPTVNPWSIHYMEGGQSSPPRPPRASRNTPDLHREDRSPCPFSPTFSRRSSGHLHRFPCCECTFKKSNDLKRHSSTVHGEQNDVSKRYRCSCGYSNACKDNYLRHHTGGKRQRATCNKVTEHVSLRNASSVTAARMTALPWCICSMSLGAS
ncbi:hypothetical protein PG994_001461 [Apiospora phragmitis]|uniref:C2H2-type domain-containing protein n=1 Tax=Apiospora phragmitis TaxID=2905665 RepID=A0ABR1WTN1_9PEZI